MLRLLCDIATDPNEPADETNPLRQVIVNTHSPTVVMAVPDESVLLARSVHSLEEGRRFSKVNFACLPGNWRNKGAVRCQEIAKGEMLSYLNPAAIILRERVIVKEQRAPNRSRPVMDHPELKLLVPSVAR